VRARAQFLSHNPDGIIAKYRRRMPILPGGTARAAPFFPPGRALKNAWRSDSILAHG